MEAIELRCEARVAVDTLDHSCSLVGDDEATTLPRSVVPPSLRVAPSLRA